jgi:putative ABC transport system ATP-binding protein
MPLAALEITIPAVALEGVTKTYGRGDGAVRALDDVSLAFEPGTFTAIMAPRDPGRRRCCRSRRGSTGRITGPCASARPT